MNRAGMLLLDLIYPNRCDCCDRRIAYDLLICETCIGELEKQRISYNEWEKTSSKEPPWRDGAVLYPYSGTARAGVLSMKKGLRGFSAYAAKQLAETLAEMFTDGEPALVTWVPMDAGRRRVKGYAHAETLGKMLAKELRFPARGDLLREAAGKTRQHDLSAAERAKYANRFSAAGKLLSGEHVLLIDDILTTGATLRRCTEQLLEIGAGAVTVAAVCATLHVPAATDEKTAIDVSLRDNS